MRALDAMAECAPARRGVRVEPGRNAHVTLRFSERRARRHDGRLRAGHRGVHVRKERDRQVDVVAFERCAHAIGDAVAAPRRVCAARLTRSLDEVARRRDVPARALETRDRRQRLHERLHVAGTPCHRKKLISERSRALELIPVDVDLHLERQDDPRDLRRPARAFPLQERRAALEHLVPRSGLEEEQRLRGAHPHRREDQPPPLRELNALAEDRQALRRSIPARHDLGEVRVAHRRLEADTAGSSQAKSLLEVGDAGPLVAELPVRESAELHAPDLHRQRADLLRSSDGAFHPCQTGTCIAALHEQVASLEKPRSREIRADRLALETVDRFVEKLAVTLRLSDVPERLRRREALRLDVADAVARRA